MKRRFILYRRKLGGTFYVEDTQTRKQESLGTKDRAEAMSLFNARNESVRQPRLNLQIAKAYLAGTDSGVSTRTWQQALDAIVETKSGSTQDRWRRAAKETALDHIRHRVILETQAEHLLACLIQVRREAGRDDAVVDAVAVKLRRRLLDQLPAVTKEHPLVPRLEHGTDDGGSDDGFPRARRCNQ
jgi:hypothetical protein